MHSHKKNRHAVRTKDNDDFQVACHKLQQTGFKCIFLERKLGIMKKDY